MVVKRAGVATPQRPTYKLYFLSTFPSFPIFRSSWSFAIVLPIKDAAIMEALWQCAPKAWCQKERNHA
jgi:hypothetical protein